MCLGHLEISLQVGFATISYWKCPSVVGTPNLDDASINSATTLRGNFEYWPGVNNTICPPRIAGLTSSTIFMKDLSYVKDSDGIWRSNHAITGKRWLPYPGTNESLVSYSGIKNPKGFNVIYGDGHSTWVNYGDGVTTKFVYNLVESSGDKYNYPAPMDCSLTNR